MLEQHPKVGGRCHGRIIVCCDLPSFHMAVELHQLRVALEGLDVTMHPLFSIPSFILVFSLSGLTFVALA